MHPAEQPADSERDQDCRVRLCFDGVAKGALEGRSRIPGCRHGIARRICDVRGPVASLAIEVLRGSLDLVNGPFDLCLGVAEGPLPAECDVTLPTGGSLIWA